MRFHLGDGPNGDGHRAPDRRSVAPTPGFLIANRVKEAAEAAAQAIELAEGYATPVPEAARAAADALCRWANHLSGTDSTEGETGAGPGD